MPLLHERATTKTFRPEIFTILIGIHLLAISAFFTFSWQGLIAFLVMGFATGCLGITLCYHRMLSHKSFKAHPWVKNFLMICGVLTLEGPPTWWVATHRLHHKEADRDLDPHSPLVSLAWSHMLWLFFSNPKLEDGDIRKKLVPDMLNDPFANFLDKAFVPINLAFAGFLFALGYFMSGPKLGLSMLTWGGFLRIVWVWHITWCVNSVTHIWGYTNYKVRDESLNLWWVGILAFGEGWHNNHHAFPATAKSGHKWWEFDPTYAIIASLKALGLASDVVPVPSHQRFAKSTSNVTPLPLDERKAIANE
jgi:fatty-acid desaturase